MMRHRIPKPELSSDYISVYVPDGGFIANNFSVLCDRGVWHMVGITQPRPEGFEDDFNYKTVHEDEHQLFHCTAYGQSFADVFHRASFTDREKLLYPSERPDEIPEIHAPHLMKFGGGFRLIYGPRAIRAADTTDFGSWTRKTLFSGEDTLRDPFVYLEDGLYRLLDCVENRVVMRTSSDCELWSEPVVLCENRFPGAPESPFLLKKFGYYYLLWTIYDGRNGCYDERTFVFASEKLEDIGKSAPITMLDAHAPEIVSDESGDWLLSVYYPNNGISAAKLKWVFD